MASSSQGEDAKSMRNEAEGVQLKKGPWTAAEDEILIDYVNKNGEGNWNAVMRNSGLQRCGKSCRLRWANHLRPDLKKGAFSAEEERLILELHAKYGNKWARMASQMPGRTDNEIKNYWNTRMKRHQRAGLDIYPSDFQSGQLHHQSRHHHHRLPRHRKGKHQALKSAPHTQMLDFHNQRAMNVDPVTTQPQPFVFTTHQTPIPAHNHQFNFFAEQRNHSLFGSILSNPPPQPMKQEHDSAAGIGSSEFGFVHLLSSDMPSLQPACSLATTAVGTDYTTHRLFNRNQGLSGTLEDVFSSAFQLGRTKNEKENDSERKKMKAASAGDEGSRAAAPPTTPENSSSGLTSIGMRMEEPLVEINPLDDELSSLLDSFPSASPTPQWYRRATVTADINYASSAHQLPIEAAANSDMDQALSLGGSGSLLLHNLPRIY